MGFLNPTPWCAELDVQGQWQRKHEVAMLCAEADVALDEFVGMISHIYIFIIYVYIYVDIYIHI